MKTHWVIFFILIALIVLHQGCAESPFINLNFWAGNSVQGGITQSQKGKTISCSSPEFDDYACLSYQDIKRIYQKIQECKQW